MFLSGFPSIEWLQGQMADSETATLAVAFWGAGAATELGIVNRSASGKPLRIVCNLRMGGTNPEEIRTLMALSNVVVEQSDALHGKVYLFDESALIGSSNASANGLSFQGKGALGWDEANVAVRDSETLAALQDWVGALRSRPIGEEDLVRAEKAWEARRGVLVPLSAKRSIADLLKDGSDALRGRGLYVVVYSSGLSREGTRAVAEAQGEHGDNVDAFEDWPDLPLKGSLICFWRMENGAVEPQDVWSRVPGLDRVASNGCPMQIVIPVDLPPDLKNPWNDRRAWRQVIEKLIATGTPHRKYPDSFFADLADLA